MAAAGRPSVPAPPAAVVVFSAPSRRVLASMWKRVRGAMKSHSSSGPSESNDESDSATIPMVERSWHKTNLEAASQLVDAVVVERKELPEHWLKGRSEPGGDDERRGSAQAASESTVPDTRVDERGSSVGNLLLRRTWPLILDFFAPIYPDAAMEAAFLKEQWLSQKAIHICGALFLLFSLVLNIALTPRPWSLWVTITNYGISPALIVPLVPMAMFNWPRRHPWVWQTFAGLAIWFGISGYIVDIKLCGYYSGGSGCGSRDFMSTYYYATSLPVVGMFALGVKRFIVFCGVLGWIALVSATILPIHITFVRTFINWMLFQGFVLVWSYMREQSDRRMYTLRAELKVQFKAKQKAQINERKTQDARRRFSNYIFHEVRVPLNTALLAVQNMKADRVLSPDSEHGLEVTALDSSLQMMSQVLNDVLDFSRMEKGGFSSVSRPFSFHRAMRSLVAPLQMDANSRDLLLTTSFDSRIDEIAKKAAEQKGSGSFEGEGIVIGDEMRLRQVVTNLASNALKFTRPGGKVTINTRLVYPSPSFFSQPAPPIHTTSHTSSASGQSEATTLVSPTSLSPTIPPSSTFGDASADSLVVRIEVVDTGVGISARDVGGLFSAYVQTEAGLSQGGKGTGLGLSLVRQIVSLSGGRLGVMSRVGAGTTMWVELPYGIGTNARESIHELDFAHSDKLARVLETPRSDAGGDDQAEFDFLSTPPLLRKSSARPILVSSPTLRDRAGPDTSPIPRTPHRSNTAPATSIPSDIVLTLPPPNTASPGSYFDRPVTSRPLGPTSPGPTTISRPGLVRAPTMNALNFERGPLRVLIVDDDQLTRRLMSRMMERLGCAVSTAENGAVALELLLHLDADLPAGAVADNFDIVFLDNQMPVCSGLQVIAKLRSLRRHDFVVGVTANAQLRDQEEFIQRGASVVLTKPVREADLRDLLVAADERRAGLRREAA